MPSNTQLRTAIELHASLDDAANHVKDCIDAGRAVDPKARELLIVRDLLRTNAFQEQCAAMDDTMSEGLSILKVDGFKLSEVAA